MFSDEYDMHNMAVLLGLADIFCGGKPLHLIFSRSFFKFSLGLPNTPMLHFSGIF